MSETLSTLAREWSWALDGWIVAAGVLSAVAASLLGVFLVLRRMSMLGDAISHAVLPGLAAAFFLTGSRQSLPMFVGAAAVGLLTALFTEWVHRYGRVDEGASMGVVFTSLFAAGLVMIVRAADHVDLDPGCVLYGALELTPLDTWRVAGLEAPRVVVVLGGVLIVNLLFVVLLYKELKISAFDPALATAVGVNASAMHYLLMTLVAVTAVASFEAVGNILVVAMFVVPPAAACLLSDRLPMLLGLSAGLAAASAVLGHAGAIVAPAWFGYGSTTTAGMMAVSAGGLFTLAALFAPRRGVVVSFVRRRLLGWRILAEDVLGLLYRHAETAPSEAPGLSATTLADALLAKRTPLRIALAAQRRRGLIRQEGNAYRLTEAGQGAARRLVRSHRLWENYLVEHVGLAADEIHHEAERLEHFTDRTLREQLDRQTADASTDPHGRDIPGEAAAANAASPRDERR